MATSDIQRRLLEAIENSPDTTQASLANQMGVAVGSVNCYMKRLIRKGYVKVTHLQRRKLRYFVTPQGLALKARLTSQNLKASLRVYRELRQDAWGVLAEVRASGYQAVHIEGDGDLAEICLLTRLEQGVKVKPDADETGIPTLTVKGGDLILRWPQESGSEVKPT